MTKSVLNRFSAVTAASFKCSVSSVLIGLAVTGTSFASGQVTSIQTSTQAATAFTYTAEGVEYRWGMGENQLMEGFITADGHSFTYGMSADRVELMRDDIIGVTSGQPCGIFVERLSIGDSQLTFAADYPSDGSGTGNCDLGSMLASRVLNRGAIDLFSNVLPDAKNIERLDYVFDHGVLAPFSQEAMALAGHVASEKSSNNPIKIAAILELDILGQPAAYGPLRLVGANGCSDPALCFGITDVRHTYSFLQNDFNAPQSFPVETERSQETIGMAFVSASELGLEVGQRYYGFSFFADDVDLAAGHDLLDPSTFPNDTSDDNIVIGDDADIHGGLSGYFIADAVDVTNGSVFNDTNGNGQPDANEAGISDISITVYEDVNGNGVLDVGTDIVLGDSIDTDVNGNFLIPGLPDGNYLIVLDENDPELPPGLVSAPGSNPQPLIIAGTDPDPINFAFINPNSNGGSDGGSDGTADSGVDGGTDGTADSGVDGGTDGTADGGLNDGSNGGVSTQAVDDTFVINQGTTGTFDVLANDIDGAGGGLTLVSVSDSPNATITIVDGQIVYEPNFGFYGTDTFLYVLEDADGTQQTGTVNVEVARFSDLNNNMLNDFIECDCTDLTLITGVDGTGVGRLSLVGFWVLIMGVLLRRRSSVRQYVDKLRSGAKR